MGGVLLGLADTKLRFAFGTHSAHSYPVKFTTHFADLNELSCGFVLNNEIWWNTESRDQFELKCKLVREQASREDVVIQVNRGKAMAERFRAEWLSNTGKPLRFDEIHWCARNPRLILPECSINHPADLLVKLPGAVWLGISCKSRNEVSERSSLKNPGIGPIGRSVGVEIETVVQETAAFIFNGQPEILNMTHAARKALIRGSAGVQALVRDEAGKLSVRLRDRLLEALRGKPQRWLETFVCSELLDAGEGTLPKYVRLTGTGDGSKAKPFSARIFDPWKLTAGEISVVPVGDVAVGFKTGYSRICKLRLKWESEPFASTLKFSVDSWDD